MPDIINKRDRYTKIFLEYYHVVFNTIYLKVGNIEDAEDLCQEVFIALFNNMEEILNMRKWIFGTLRNVVLKYYRDRKSTDELFEDMALTFVNGFRDLRLIINDSIQSAIKEDIDNSIVDLIGFHSYSYSNTSKLLGLTKRQVEYRYSQIVKRVIHNLNTHGISNIEDLL
jgi:RNA polymerase sigma factor (sigma-70 family)